MLAYEKIHHTDESLQRWSTSLTHFLPAQVQSATQGPPPLAAPRKAVCAVPASETRPLWI